MRARVRADLEAGGGELPELRPGHRGLLRAELLGGKDRVAPDEPGRHERDRTKAVLGENWRRLAEHGRVAVVERDQARALGRRLASARPGDDLGRRRRLPARRGEAPDELPESRRRHGDRRPVLVDCVESQERGAIVGQARIVPRMRPLKFCMITTFYPPQNFGGDGIFIHRLTNELAKAGHGST